MIGLKFGRLTVATEVEKRVKPCGQKERMFFCICECGSESTVRSYSLKHGLTKSCGCLSIDSAKHRATTHGMSLSKIERVYHSMKQRCNNPNNQAYARYGGRGITVCEEWQTFEVFLRDMGDSYAEGLTIDRVNNNEGYSKGNCKWIPAASQARNKRNNLKFMYKGEIKTLIEICEKEHKNYNMVRQRLTTYGQTFEEAMRDNKGRVKTYQKGVDFIRRLLSNTGG